MPVLYNTNRFHFTLLPTNDSVQGVVRHFLLHLHLIQYVSIDNMLHAYGSSIVTVDRVISTQIRSMIPAVLNSTLFTLHLELDWAWNLMTALGDVSSDMGITDREIVDLGCREILIALFDVVAGENGTGKIITVDVRTSIDVESIWVCRR